MTLIEVVAGLVVLAVLISSVTVARGRFMRQWGEARRKVEAAEAVDRMLAGWIGGGGEADAIPVPARGRLDAVEGCVWQTNWAADAGASRLGAGVVRLEVSRGGGTLMSVDLLKHLPPPPDREGRR